eukprot:TRINITY_DN2522_c0_g2_i1.p2 TRINITY_DN2522_c0_g2~~TRINITY_DN2522_c0_g2_i1.p2  ORF type:complete len:80 (+),score=21.55 TRINITY_DN2522_c0_g2_i1:407-646(+)
MFEVMFEEFQVESSFIQTQAPLALFSEGLISSCVFDCGEGISHTIPYFKTNNNETKYCREHNFQLSNSITRPREYHQCF